MNYSNIKIARKAILGLLAGAAMVTTFGLAGYGVNNAAHAQAVKIANPAQPGFADVVEKVSPAVVSVRVKGKVQPVSDDMGHGQFFGGQGFDDLPDDHPLKRFFRDFGERGEGRNMQRPRERGIERPRSMSQGSGFFISEDGYLVTNNHVVQDGEDFVVVTNDGAELDAKLIGKDSKTDLAVLKVDADRKFTYVAFDAATKPRVGDWVVAVGNPFGLGGTVTAGIVSALGRDIGAGPYDDFIQIDAAVNRGNSGGPAFDLEGEVIGVNTAIFSPSGGNVGIAFAIPAATANEVVNDLIRNGTISRGWLGIQIQPVSADIAESLGLAKAAGALVNEVQSTGPALKAGVQVGDVVLRISGADVADPKDLARKVAAIKPGTSAQMTVWRDGAEKNLTVSIEKLKDAAAGDLPPQAKDGPAAELPRQLTQLGIKVAPDTSGTGIVVTDVDPGGAAAERGLSIGDVIISANDRPTNSVADLSSAIDAAARSGRKSALVQVEGERGPRFIALPVSKG